MRNIAAVREDRRDSGPTALPNPALGEKLIVVDCTLIAEQLDIEGVRHDAFDGRRHFPERPVVKFHQRQTVRLVLVAEGIVGAEVRVSKNLDSTASHEPSHSIHCVASGREQAAPTDLFLDIPLVLPVPRPDPVEVIHLTIEQPPHHAVREKNANGFK